MLNRRMKRVSLPAMESWILLTLLSAFASIMFAIGIFL